MKHIVLCHNCRQIYATAALFELFHAGNSKITITIEHIALILGGAKSGKSKFAERLALSYGLDPVYVATATSDDEEMAKRIKLHTQSRSDAWQLIEEPYDLIEVFALAKSSQVLLVDCLTLWLSNIYFANRDITTETQNLLAAANHCPAKIVFVSNEIGMGLVPETLLGRQFRDAQGHLNQQVAKASGLAVFVAAGLPLALKGSLPKGVA